MTPRPPIVTILGHVDHGKTTLLDFIRTSRLAAKEHGGITQGIGAYEISTGIKGYPTDKITFIDTPGHEAFTKLRARGAKAADIALLIIDGKDSLRPQTVESIAHIKTANIPYIVVLNKIDLPDAMPDKVKTDLLKHEVLVEGKGGNVPVAEISAKTGKGVPELLETILLLTSENHLEYDPQAPFEAYIIETKKDKRGIIVSAIIQQGTLKVTDQVYTEGLSAKVRALVNDLGTQVKEVVPSTPFELLGFSDMPEVGSRLTASASEAKAAVEELAKKEFTLKSFLEVAPEASKKITVVLKADSQGSLEAIVASLAENENVDLLSTGVGEINKTDVFLAKPSKAIVIGFNMKPNQEVTELAKQEKVVIKTYNIIYELIDELTEVASLLKEKEENEKHVKGEAKILATFVIEGEKIWGIKVTKGKLNLGDGVELHRSGNLIGKTKAVSVRIRSKVVDEVKKDQEAGIILSPPLDTRVGDMIQFTL